MFRAQPNMVYISDLINEFISTFGPAVKRAVSDMAQMHLNDILTDLNSPVDPNGQPLPQTQARQQPSLAYITDLINEYRATMKPATLEAVTQVVQQHLNTVIANLSLPLLPEPASEETTQTDESATEVTPTTPLDASPPDETAANGQAGPPQ